MLTDAEIAALAVAIYALDGIAGGYSKREKQEAKAELIKLLLRDRAGKA